MSLLIKLYVCQQHTKKKLYINCTYIMYILCKLLALRKFMLNLKINHVK